MTDIQPKPAGGWSENLVQLAFALLVLAAIGLSFHEGGEWHYPTADVVRQHLYALIALAVIQFIALLKSGDRVSPHVMMACGVVALCSFGAAGLMLTQLLGHEVSGDVLTFTIIYLALLAYVIAANVIRLILLRREQRQMAAHAE